MDKRTYNLIGPDYPGNRAEDVKDPSLGWMTAFAFVVSIVGIMALVPLRKVMIIEYKLTYPSGTATAVLINSFHTTEGAETAQKQVGSLGKAFALRFLWSFFKWFFSGIGDSCGFDNFPTLGLKAYANTFYFDFSTTYVGVGMICPHIVNCSVLFGAMISWGIMWPIIGSQAAVPADDELAIIREKQNRIFLQDHIPLWFAASGYAVLSVISMIAIPQIFTPVRWTYGKLGLFMFAAWVGSNGGVIAGLAACGVMMSIVSTAADLMQDFKIGLLTVSSPRSMFVSQLLGTCMGCVLAPLTFWMFWSAFNIGLPDGEYKAPYAVIFRQMAILGVEGLSALPKYCLGFCCAFFVLALLINLFRDFGLKQICQYLPIPMAMGIPFYIGAYFAIDMFIGTAILYVWERLNRKEADV
ncbi:hypothetical protein O6H91_01G125500 [Diphasiastrum complanatum]|uniref:Uncharacterized protein n=1 Tax=Diphasiastrum complanatum TaxID=34168 RepID=A0ACC2EVR8_DIPCM|nr:hypothetical protein O6H91_01G125500 [Diphasiastrum complanatum]